MDKREMGLSTCHYSLCSLPPSWLCHGCNWGYKTRQITDTILMVYSPNIELPYALFCNTYISCG